jgi:hypothetical protein
MTTADQVRRRTRILAGLGTLLVLGWGVSYALPATREMLLPFALSFLFNLLLVAMLWQNARWMPGMRRFWGWLAVGWGLNLAGNIAWGVHDLTTGGVLATLSIIDGFYIARYVAVAVAFLTYRPRSARRWEAWVLMAVAATALVWLALYRPVLGAGQRPFGYFAGLAIYPVLDLPLIYIALLAWARAPAALSNSVLGLTTLAMVSYGVANWLNFSKRAVTLEAYTHLADLFWFLTDVLTGGAAVYAAMGSLQSAAGEAAPAALTEDVALPRPLRLLPFLAGAVPLGLLILDLVVGPGTVDAVLAVCSGIALLMMGLYQLRTQRRK